MTFIHSHAVASCPMEVVLCYCIIETVLNKDIYSLDNVHRDKSLMHLLLKSLARNESSTATLKTFQNDIKANGDRDITTDTISSYLDILNKLLLIDDQLPFSSRLRSSVRVRQQVNYLHPKGMSASCFID